MYQAKEAGRDRTEVFSVATRDRIVARFDTETELRHAIAHGELSLAYQPQIDLRSGRVVGFEALVRWDHPERGRLLPATFMSVAEESGLVVPLGRWVLAEVCRTLAADQQSGNRLPRVAINISACEISSEFVTDLAELVTETGARPTALCLELTESVLLADADSARVIMTELADLGVQLSLDDFGTGYSSLAMLKQLPLRELKIDRSFVNQLHEPDGRSLVEAVIGMANALGLDTVAEGVEQPDQARSLGELGCAMGQGYLFGHPLPLAQALAYRPMVPTQRSNDTHRVRSGTWRGIDRPSPGPSEEPRAGEVFPATR
jgi:EAL domain-containing protein (putative c-di-GMP-specific phosphodiesterase class I)